MTDKEKEETEKKKIEGGKEGKQFVGNTGKAKGAREKANDDEEEAYEGKKRKERGEEDAGEEEEEEDIVDDEDGEEDEEYEEDGADEDGEEDEEDAKDDDDDGDVEAQEKDQKPSTRGQKRGKSSNGTASNKKQKSNSGSAKSKPKSNGNDSKKTIGSKHQPADAPAPQASADRLPSKGQSVTWKALPGWVEGEVIDVVYKDTTIEGKSTKAKEGDPRIFMRSKNGKVAVHKPEAVYFE